MRVGFLTIENKNTNPAIVEVKRFEEDIEILPYILYILSHDDLHKINNCFITQRNGFSSMTCRNLNIANPSI